MPRIRNVWNRENKTRINQGGRRNLNSGSDTEAWTDQISSRTIYDASQKVICQPSAKHWNSSHTSLFRVEHSPVQLQQQEALCPAAVKPPSNPPFKHRKWFYTCVWAVIWLWAYQGSEKRPDLLTLDVGGRCSALSSSSFMRCHR